jgi:hypothetical protein
VQQLEQRGAAHGRRHVLHGHRVVEVPAGGDDGEQQVMADGLGHQLDVGLVQPHPFAHVARHDLTGHAVVTGPALADVMQQRRQQQQVGAGDVPGQRGRVGGALHQMPVDREAVQRVALRPVPHPLPVRDQRGQQPLLVERLPDRDGA